MAPLGVVHKGNPEKFGTFYPFVHFCPHLDDPPSPHANICISVHHCLPLVSICSHLSQPPPPSLRTSFMDDLLPGSGGKIYTYARRTIGFSTTFFSDQFSLSPLAHRHLTAG